MSHGRHLADDLLLPELDTAQTVRVGHSPLPLDESDCDLAVQIAELRTISPRQQSIETLLVRRPGGEIEVAPTVLLTAARDPAEYVPRCARRRDRSTLVFALLLLAISLASLAAGVLIGPHW